MSEKSNSIGDRQNIPDSDPQVVQTTSRDFVPQDINPSCFDRIVYEGRRRKAAVLLIVIWSGTIALHLLSWGLWLIWGMVALMGIHAIRVLTAKPSNPLEPLPLDSPSDVPLVSLLVAAKNEERVIAPLVKMLCTQDYPLDHYEVWVIDDNSSDRTPQVLESLCQEYPHLRVMRRSAEATGGKSGALNQVLPLTRGEVLAVFDADAQVAPDLLRRVLPGFDRQEVGAIQLQKAIANAPVNVWTHSQASEMALDAYFQQQRIALGGIGELRGNGQFVRRTALEQCGGWNEETITDDLDLTLRLHLEQWDVDFILDPPVQEEGVTSALALWHQRNRWAEGGYQRYMDYWRLIFSKRMPWMKIWDMLIFWIMQYFIPNAAIPDCLMAIAKNRLPVYSPMTTLMVGMSVIAMIQGIRRVNRVKGAVSSLPTLLWQTLRGTIYMLHWLLIVASTSARIAVRPKTLKWVKTTHKGTVVVDS
ncbi:MULTISPECIES: glycosyltransferase family 2 protein [unclassified Roseofilum]|uniref:glycosyltransferase n=1 Tax=unclassified Roseofilum TaxID=2620099 RepID=UPI000E80DC35|nr:MULTISPECIES: glycosyltransferase family 2 protein [unclassified Roseofilum]MBP0008574.1 glycosyltransferase family 2 protein [Roseofilum sp. Belize Diploria]MBP0033826.1 glycosyltransferase family 2 protein [Roseofilum sp. Belize BBD 4]HBR00884.1 glycosyl transferase [Cyanobacteria bacterium UBA11691]